MTNKAFNKAIKSIFEKTAHDDELISLVADLWLENDTTQEQDETLERLKTDAYLGQASCPKRYFLDDSKWESFLSFFWKISK